MKTVLRPCALQRSVGGSILLPIGGSDMEVRTVMAQNIVVLYQAAFMRSSHTPSAELQETAMLTAMGIVIAQQEKKAAVELIHTGPQSRLTQIIITFR